MTDKHLAEWLYQDFCVYPSTTEGFEELLDITPEFSNAHELFHNKRHHPEGDHSLRAHMMACFKKWSLNGLRSSNADQSQTGMISYRSRYLSFWALFFHDIGKQATATLKCENMDGSITHSFIKHESVGADIFCLHYAHHFKSQDADAIEYCIREHMNFWNINKHGKVEAMKNHEHFWLLAEVCLCDKMGFKNKEWKERLARFDKEVVYHG